ncbi:MAG: GNAT family N-acetyltransferase [Ardenticatenaceae bacterium]|nr:GNAT family N-acetyltransferase [Ardenticatenaceae bacterium]
MEIALEFVQYDSPAWHEARRLRYALFFAPHDLAPSFLDDEQETAAAHLVAIEEGHVIGCGRLVDRGQDIFQISQMAVNPAYQGRGIGKMLLRRLIQKAKEQGGLAIVLSARLTAVSLYERAGFQKEGEVYPSASTDVPHIKMSYELNRE